MFYRLVPAGHLLLPFVAKVSKSTLLPVEEVRSGGKFFRFNISVKTNFVLFCLKVIEITLYPTEKFTLLQLNSPLKLTDSSV